MAAESLRLEATAEPEPWASPLPPAIGAHRMLSDGHSMALVRADGHVDWWCAPRCDSTPLLWSLLDPDGACARWVGARMARVQSPPAGPALRTVLVTGGGRVETLDALVRVGATEVLLRLIRGPDGPVPMRHRLSVGGFDSERGEWRGATARVGGLEVAVVGGSHRSEHHHLWTSLDAGPHWTGLAVSVGSTEALPDVEELASLALEAEQEAGRRLEEARLPRRHPERARDALAVLHACTYEPTGAVIASPTTSLPEAAGADRQFDYRFSWLRDAALAVSVASLLGERGTAERYLAFVRGVAGEAVPESPMTTVGGGMVPGEREVDGVAGWAGSRPVRVGNAAAQQVQYDALGMVVEAVSVYLQTGGSLDDATWSLVRRIADHLAEAPAGATSGIWELREPRHLVSADLGRWLGLDRAVWIARGWQPLARRGQWKRARAAARARVLGVLGPDGRLPQSYDGPRRADASALMAPLFGMVSRRDPRARAIVEAVLADLDAYPFVYRYEPDETDGFAGREGAFVPMAWWAVSALAAVGRVDEARRRLDDLCARLPRLMAEQVDPESDASLGNVPLVWSHMEAARSLYILDAAERRARWGAAGLWGWRLARYASLRWARR